MNSKQELWKEIKKCKFVYIWIAPFFVLFGIFGLFPIFFSVYISLHKWSGFGVPSYIGLSNFDMLFHDIKFWIALKNYIVIWLMIVPLRTFLALTIAYILNSASLRIAGLFRTVFFLPYITAMVIVAVIFRVMLSAPGGWVNLVLQFIGIGPIPFLSSTVWSKPAVCLLNIWRSTGYFIIIMLAGLQRIPPTLYEAAVIDGAGRIQSFFRITIPLMVPIILFVFTMSTIWLAQMLVEPLVLTGGGPRFSSTTMGLFLLQEGFFNLNLGYAAAIGIAMFGIIFIFSFLHLRLFPRK